jgi:acyl-CoA thioesterase
MSSFLDASTLTAIAKGRTSAVVDATWQQGRGAYGGLTAALLLRAIGRELPEGQRVVRITTAFCAPLLPGPVEIEVEVVRAGRNVSVLHARLLIAADGERRVVATAMATACRAREHPLRLSAPVMPDMPRLEDVADGPDEHYQPTFAKRFSFRQCIGPRPFSGEGPGRVGGWCRLNEDGPIDGPLLTALLDAWPPAAVGLSERWCPVASLELTVDIETDAPIAERTWLFYDARCERIASGLAEERATLHLPDGRRIASAQQLIALLPAP